MTNLRKRGIGQESIKGLAKPQLKWQRGESWQMAIIITKCKFRRKRQISAKMASVPKIHQGFGQIFGWDNKKGHLDKWRFYENDKCGKNLFKVWQKLKQDDKRGMSIIVGFTKMTYFAKPANLARTETMKQQNRHIDRWRFTQKWQIWENGELGKNPSTVWQNLIWGDKEGNIEKR